MRKKSAKEKLAVNAARQKRWREKNARTHRERVATAFGRAKAQGFFKDGVTPEEVARYAKVMEKKQREIQATHYALEPGVDTGYGAPVAPPQMEPEQKGGHDEDRNTRVREGSDFGVTGADGEAGRSGEGALRGDGAYDGECERPGWADRGIGTEVGEGGAGNVGDDGARGIQERFISDNIGPQENELGTEERLDWIRAKQTEKEAAIPEGRGHVALERRGVLTPLDIV